MEAQIDQADIRYPIANNTQPRELIYKLRHNNDQLLLQMISINNQNKKLQDSVHHLKEKTPTFLLNWWKSNQSVEKMHTFLHQLNTMLQEEIEAMSRKLHEFRNECEINQADYSEELNLTVELQRNVVQLEQKLQNLRQNSNAFGQFEELWQSQNTDTLRKCNSVRNELRIVADQRRDFQQQINTRFSNRTHQNSEQDYYNQMEFVVAFLIERKKVLKDKLREIEYQIDRQNQLINAEQQERQIKNQLKRSILEKRSQLESLKRTLREAQHEKEMEGGKLKELEQEYCLLQMDRVVDRVKQHKVRTEAMMGRTLDLLTAVQQHPNIPQIQKNMYDY